VLGERDGGAESTRAGAAPLRRAFVAVVPSPAALRWTESVTDSARRIADESRRIGGELRWSRPDQRHITLQFLGRVDESDSLAESVAESVRRVQPFTVVLGGAGAFPSARRASVLWIGVAQGADEFAALAAAVSSSTAPLGFAGEDRPFRPHLTLARLARARDLRPVVAALDDGPAAPPFTVDHVVLFESDTRPDGAVHTEVARCPLTAGTGNAPC
jgi:2'-5' RNA ligase